MLASLKFFLGQDDAAEAGSDDEGNGGPTAARRSAADSGLGPAPAGPTSKDVYSAKSKANIRRPRPDHAAEAGQRACLVWPDINKYPSYPGRAGLWHPPRPAGSGTRCDPPPGAQGTNSSKRKKAAKLKRVMHAVKKHERREAGFVSESFAAMQLLHDPQVGTRLCGGHPLLPAAPSDAPPSPAVQPARRSSI